MPRKKHLVFATTNDLVFDQRMQRIATALSGNFHVSLIGRKLPASPPLPGHWPFHGLRFRNQHTRGKRFYAEHNYHLYRWLLQLKPAIIGAVDADTLPACAMAAQKLGAALVYDSHEYFIQLPELEGRPAVRKAWDVLEKHCISKARLCYTVNDSLAAVLSARFQKPFATIRNVPWREKAALPGSGNRILEGLPKKFLLYQGALNAGRGLEVLLEIIAGHAPLQLVLCGEGDLSQQLRHQAKALKLENRVHFLGRVAPEVLHAITQRAWMGYNVLAPMGLSYYYSLANKFFDYMHAGTPSLNSDFPEYQKIISATGCGMAIPYDKENIKQALAQCWQAPEKIELMRSNALKAAPHYCWEAEAKKLCTLYEFLSE
mgnify:CR=1 FL=1